MMMSICETFYFILHERMYDKGALESELCLNHIYTCNSGGWIAG